MEPGPIYDDAYAESVPSPLDRLRDQVDGNAARFVEVLNCAVLPPDPVSRNWIVPEPVGVSTAIQYFVPFVTAVEVTVTVFHAPAVGLLIVPCAMRVFGASPRNCTVLLV